MPASAGIVDSPITAPFTVHVYSVSGVMNGGSFGTFFACTNVDAADSITVGVEVFGPAGGAPLNNAATTAISVASGATILLGTQSSPALPVDGNLAVGIVSKGSARIVATSKKIVCTAFLSDPSGNPPVSMTSLNIIAKAKQKGD